ncbi:hypothetical protein A2Z33_01855 [Candidatus Gottesmanbacteria bacterium RBG_16_52_11]|uniref:Uncharacterized protein n=1 Tax=Candidatus Gottesmanbacteria bacterium RBG_16_52_11 TaxID=1798374 RepID=A0A1F5YRL7_9BACT|nr:MAG: hypothetical protein A2Z33_01855 [Candidatus Gottesmanbacteria bacterium RBG_16_52_11]
MPGSPEKEKTGPNRTEQLAREVLSRGGFVFYRPKLPGQPEPVTRYVRAANVENLVYLPVPDADSVVVVTFPETAANIRIANLGGAVMLLLPIGEEGLLLRSVDLATGGMVQSSEELFQGIDEPAAITVSFNNPQEESDGVPDITILPFPETILMPPPDTVQYGAIRVSTVPDQSAP